tara:strand:+ start:184 stop:1488 length:1305 start_codon:yes stop_codon:yes gene_type:complete
MLTSGLSFLNRSAVNSSNTQGNSDQIQGLKDAMFAARVSDISLNTNSKLYELAGNNNGIGSIQFQALDTNSTKENLQNGPMNIAKPLFPQFKNYPLVNEVVLIFKLPSRYQTAATGVKDFYYLNAVNLWNHPNNNGIPSEFEAPNTEAGSNKNKSALSILIGNVQRNTDEVATLDFNGDSGANFVENANIRPLISFAGDNIFEGRFGNSIRLGSTALTSGKYKNNWSKNALTGSAITILRNGQSGSSEPGFIPTVEDINFDLSSLYLTSNQQIPIELAIARKASGEGKTTPYSDIVNKAPQDPTTYEGSQIILNSGRLLFQSKEDYILMSSQKSVAIEAVEDVGIKSNTGNTYITSESGITYLGKTDAGQSLILGDDFIAAMKTILNNLDLVLTGIGNSPNIPGAAAAAKVAQAAIKPIEKKLNQFKSNYVKTK